MPRSRAKWLSVPSGRIPSRVRMPAMADAAALMLPSPPPTISNSSPRSAIARDRVSQLPPSTISMVDFIPARRRAVLTLSAISGSPLIVPPPRFSSTVTVAPRLLRILAADLTLLAGALAGALAFGERLDAHRAVLAADFHVAVRRGAFRRVGSG